MDISVYRGILKKYWGYDEFRPLQEDIISSIAAGKDTLALMPTGGGKSVTFQVPALAHEGICLVITPLIALMKDQVARLNSMSAKALAIHSGMMSEEIDNTIENAIFGNYKFLYVSPERLSTRDFLGRIGRLNLSLVAIDEAHCISQWGYDFRPSYLKIAAIRDLISSEVPFLALTATATPPVIQDIMDKLAFRDRNIMRTSFKRDNLTYLVRRVEDKGNYLVNTIQKARGSGIVYVRSRKRAKEVAETLVSHGISAGYYHAGLSNELRDSRQGEWTKGKTRVIVATNAFGMGIDKPDVRFVIHWDIPDSLENYFQESGRAGRDGIQASAVLLYSPADKSRLIDGLRKKFPPVEKIKDVYEALCNHLRIPLGSGKDVVYDFRLAEFVAAYRLPVTETVNSLQFLQREGLMEFTEEINNPSRVHFIVGRDDLYRFQVANEAFDNFIKLLLRSYTGMFSEFVPVNEDDLSRKSGADRDTIYQYLTRLSSVNVIRYIPGKKTSLVIFRDERLTRKALMISPDNYLKVRERYEERIDKMLAYADTDSRCRTVILLDYFGEETDPCGRCDACRAKTDRKEDKGETIIIREKILELLTSREYDPAELIIESGFSSDKVINSVRWLLDNNLILRNKAGRLIKSE
jgi:ATP-dependent DNA helicase RecQ